jgi:ribA/ribD-fused uncharacterized protein
VRPEPRKIVGNETEGGETAKEGQLQPEKGICSGNKRNKQSEERPQQIGVGRKEGEKGTEVLRPIERIGEAGPSSSASGKMTLDGTEGGRQQREGGGNQEPITFMGKRCKLSNFYPCRVNIFGQVFSSSEGAYQWRKAMFMRDRGVAEQNRGMEEAREAKAAANNTFGKQAWKHWDDERKELLSRWDWEKLSVMRQILRAKARGCKEFVKELRDTGGRQLQEIVPGERFWGIDQGTGLNWMGRLLMEVRDTLETTLSQTNEEEGTHRCPGLGEGVSGGEYDRGSTKRGDREEEESCKRRRRVTGHEYANREIEVEDPPVHGIFFGSSQLKELVQKHQR